MRSRTAGSIRWRRQETVEGDVKLYNWQLSPNCRRLRMFILEKGMDMPEIEQVGATAEHLVPGGQFGLSDNLR